MCDKNAYMKKHLTRFLPLARSSFEMCESKPYSAFARVQDHVQELRRFFELPDDELFLDEFYCALHKRILLQGRMYIFEHYLCFYSNVFGWVKQKVIPLHSVKEITKKRNYGFPNSVEVIWKKREFFTSFLNRNDAYELLCDAVKHVRGNQVPPSDDMEGMQKDSGASSSTSSNSSTNLVSRPSGGRSPKRLNKTVSEPCEEDSDLEVNDDEIDIWSVISGSAPVVPDNMECLCKDSFDVSVQEFFSRTLTMDSMFLDEYHKRRGDTRYRISEWERLHGISGFVRQATFVSPVKGVRGIGFISPKKTECNQDHRLRIYDGDHLVFQISQVMKDIPYGDNFSVEMRWDVKPDEDGGCRISVYVAVPFIRSVMAPFRSMIESNVMKEMQESVKIMTEMLKVTLSTNPEPHAEDPEPSERGETDANPRSAQILSKLTNLLGNEQSIQKLEQIVGSTELRIGKQPASLELPPQMSIANHQNTAAMNIQTQPVSISPTNWILFFCCLFMLFCQVMLILLWIVTPTNPGYGSPYERLDGLLEQPLKQLHELEETLVAITEMLNATLMNTMPSQCHS